jgi:hypothetical protein
MKPCAPVGPQPMDFDPWGKPGSTSPPLVPPKDREGAPHDSSSHHRAYRPRTTAVSLSVERAMIGVMPSRTWESQLGWLVTDLRLWPSARSRPFNAPGPAGTRAAAEYVLPTTRQRAFPNRSLGRAFTAGAAVAVCRIQRKSRFQASNRRETLLYQTVVQWVMAQIRYLAEQWNFCTEQRIFDALTIE